MPSCKNPHAAFTIRQKLSKQLNTPTQRVLSPKHVG